MRRLTKAGLAMNNEALRPMYRRPKFLEKLLDIRREMAAEADYDVDLFAEIARSGNRSARPRPSAAERLSREQAGSSIGGEKTLKVGRG